jgi:hypothetical protein
MFSILLIISCVSADNIKPDSCFTILDIIISDSMSRIFSLIVLCSPIPADVVIIITATDIQIAKMHIFEIGPE